MNPVILTIRQIDLTDTIYNIFINKSSNEASPEIVDSLIVQQSGHLFRLIDGFDVLHEDLPGGYSFPAYCIPSTESFDSVLEILIKNRLKKHSLLPLEIARIFRLALDNDVSEAKIVKTLFPLLHLAPKQEMIKRYLTLLTVTEIVADYLILKNATLKTWLQITQYPENDRNFIEDLIQLQPTLSVLEEIVQFLYEIQKRDTISQSQLLEQLTWSDFFRETDLSPKARLQQLRSRVFEKRFPQLSGHRKKVDEMINDLGLPGNAEISYDETFEKRELNLRWRLSSGKDVDNMDRFSSEEKSRKIREILDKF